LEGLVKYAVEMGSGAMIYIPCFIKIGSGIQKFIRGIHRHRDSKVISCASLHFLNNIERKGKIVPVLN
jgi:hypothetical protein